MELGEFLDKVNEIQPVLHQAQRTGSDEDISNLILTLALHGLVVMAITDKIEEIPQPICQMIFIPNNPQDKRERANHYLFPADQMGDKGLIIAKKIIRTGHKL